MANGQAGPKQRLPSKPQICCLLTLRFPRLRSCNIHDFPNWHNHENNRTRGFERWSGIRFKTWKSPRLWLLQQRYQRRCVFRHRLSRYKWWRKFGNQRTTRAFLISKKRMQRSFYSRFALLSLYAASDHPENIYAGLGNFTQTFLHYHWTIRSELPKFAQDRRNK